MNKKQGGMRRRGSVTALVAAAGMLGVSLGGAVYGQSGQQPDKKPPAKSTPPVNPPANTPPSKTTPNQPASPSKTQPGTSQPGQPGTTTTPAAQPKKAPTEGPYVKKDQSKNLTLAVNVNIRTDSADDRNAQGMPIINALEFKTLAVVFPLLTETGSSKAGPAYAKDRGKDPEKPATDNMIRGELFINDQSVTRAATLMEGDKYQGARLGRWDARDMTAREIELRLTLPVTCYRTTLDEKAAVKVAWPTGDWPTSVASTFAPQMYVNMDSQGPYNMDPVKEAVKRWTKGNPKAVPPMTLAKYIAGQVMEMIQPSGDGLTFGRNGELEGIGLAGGPYTIQSKRGSEFDAVCALVACYREAGLPARTVIGYAREGADESKDNFLNRRKGQAELRAWAEFCLYDEPNNTINWVPVDIIRMRKQSSRAPRLEQPWPYFGTNKDLNEVVPFALQFHPPTTVMAYGSPGFWGWMVTPKPPAQAYQALRFAVTVSSARAPEKDEKDKRTR